MYDIKIDSFSFSSYKNIVIDKVEGFSPPSSTISRTKLGKDGTSFTGSTRNERNIVINFSILNNVKNTREVLYNNIITGNEVTVTVNSLRKITGYIESFELNNFQQITTGQIAIICPDPYFYSLSPKRVHFYNSSSVTINAPNDECDFIIRVDFSAVSNEFEFDYYSISGITITQHRFYITNEFKTNDTLIIDSANRKITVNGINKYSSKNWITWPKLKKGNNKWSITASNINSGYIEISEKYFAI